jgi:hypothetical protein
MPDPEAAPGVTEKPTLSTHDPIQPIAADPGRHSSRPCDQGVPVPGGSPGVEDTEQVVLKDDLGDAQRSELAGDLLFKGRGFLSSHRNQGQHG